MDPADKTRLRHIVDAARELANFIAGKSRPDLDSDRMLLFAVVRGLDIIGEASSQISPPTRRELPEVPWRAIIGMRNRIIHAYFDIDRDIVWKAAAEEAPAIRELLERHIGVEGG